MFGFLRFVLMALVASSVLHVLIKIYVRSLVREHLENEWANEGKLGPRADYVAQGLAQYERSLRRKLLLGIYLFPMIIFCVIFYTMNFM